MAVVAEHVLLAVGFEDDAGSSIEHRSIKCCD